MECLQGFQFNFSPAIWTSYLWIGIWKFNCRLVKIMYFIPLIKFKVEVSQPILFQSIAWETTKPNLNTTTGHKDQTCLLCISYWQKNLPLLNWNLQTCWNKKRISLPYSTPSVFFLNYWKSAILLWNSEKYFECMC